MAKKILPILVIIVLSILAGFPLLHKGLPPTQDGEYHVIRFYEFYKVLENGSLYPRWAPDLNFGYGVPLFNFVYPLPNYFAAFFHLFGASFIDAFKLNMFLATIVGSIFFYFWTKEFWGQLGGIVGSVFYTFSPYHFLDIYIRGSVGEVWALAFFPAFLWSITIMMKNQRKIYLIISSIFLSLIIFSHNILALMFLPFSIIYVLFLFTQLKKWNLNIIIKLVFIYLCGIGIASIFWLPALFEKKFVTGLEVFDYKNYFPDLYELIIPSWGSGFADGDIANRMSFQIGIVNILAVIVSFFAFLYFFIKKKLKQRNIILFFLFLFIIIFYLMQKISMPIWNSIPLMNYFQFPWRFLSLEILVISFLSGCIFAVKESKILAFLMIVIVIILSINYTKPAYYHYRNDNYYITRSNFIDGTNSPGNEFNTIWMKKLTTRENKSIFFSPSNRFLNQKMTSNSRTFSYKSNKIFSMNIPIAYFPGWIAFVDNNQIKIIPNKDGFISIIAPKGSHSVAIRFVDTSVRSFAFLMTICSLFLLCVVFVRIWYKRYAYSFRHFSYKKR